METKVFPARVGAAIVKSVWVVPRIRSKTSDPAHSLTIFPGVMVGDVDGGDVIESGTTLTLDCQDPNGVNALDTGSLGSSNWYAIYLIKQPGGAVASLASLSFTNPTMPSGYTLKRIISAVRTDGSANIKRMEQVDRYVVYTENDGIFLSTFPGNLDDTSIAAYVSPVSRRALLGFYIYCYDGDTGRYYYAPAALYNGDSPVFLANTGDSHDDNDNCKYYNSLWLPVDENRHICIGSDGNRDKSDVRVQGYTIDS